MELGKFWGFKIKGDLVRLQNLKIKEAKGGISVNEMERV